MKKVIFTIFIILFLPIYVSAYSKYIIPGGESIGININSDGLIVVGYYKVHDNYINKNIKISDRIIEVNDIKVRSVNELINVLNNSNSNIVNVKIIRNNKIVSETLILKEEKNTLKTGLYIKDSIIGIGTLTYIDPVTKIYGSLGHEIVLNETNSKVEVRNGNIFDSVITSITKSRDGYVGTKKASIIFSNNIGTIEKNTNNGLYGFYTNKIPDKNTFEISDFEDIKKGYAYILTVTTDNLVEKYEINILDKYYNRKNTSKSFGFEVTDKKLLSKTGGIVQGMSGSPIIQDNKIIGAVTNVIIDDVSLGYGISIKTMLEEGDKLRN